MFTSNDYIRARKGFFFHLGVMALILVMMAAIFAVMLALRLRIVGSAVLLIGAWAAYFYGTMVFAPWKGYYRLVSDMHGGLSRTSEVLFVGVSKDSRVLDGVEVKDFIVCEDADKNVEMLYLWDADKPVPEEYTKGQKLRIESFGKYIKNIEVV